MMGLMDKMSKCDEYIPDLKKINYNASSSGIGI